MMPTTSVRRQISLFDRSCGLLDRICFQRWRGKAVEAKVGLGLAQVLGMHLLGGGLVEDGDHAVAVPRHDGTPSTCGNSYTPRGHNLALNEITQRFRSPSGEGSRLRLAFVS